eukprot:4731174-Alexandrium_andersonii.AAC.1
MPGFLSEVPAGRIWTPAMRKVRCNEGPGLRQAQGDCPDSIMMSDCGHRPGPSTVNQDRSAPSSAIWKTVKRMASGKDRVLESLGLVSFLEAYNVPISS